MSVKHIKVAVPITDEEEVAAVREVILSGNLVSGANVAEFERRFASFIGVSGASAVNSGTAALHIALAVLGVGPGDEVIVPSLTFMSTVTCVLHQNAIPVFADIDRESFCISPEDVKRRITAHTKAIIPVHLFGNAASMDDIMGIAEEHRLHVIEDCAQAHGTEYKGKRVGSIGHMGAFSFYATKHMTTGEGGIITTDNQEWIEAANKIRNHGMSGRDEHVVLGYNYRMNEIAAAMGLVQLRKLPQLNETRISNSRKILEALAGEGGRWFRVPELSPDVRHTFFWCPLIIRTEAGYETRDIVKRLGERGVEVRHRYVEPLYRQKVMQDASPYPSGCPYACASSMRGNEYRTLFLPNVEALAGNIIGLPNHAALKDEEIEYVVKTVRDLF